MTLAQIIDEGTGANLLANQVERFLKSRKQNENVHLTTVVGNGPSYTGVLLRVRGKLFLISVKELDA